MKKRAWAYFYMPILFLIIGYGTLYIVLAPVLNFVSSTVSLFLLNEPPTFEKAPEVSFFDEKKESAPVPDEPNDPTLPESIPSSEIVYPSIGDEYGRVLIEKVGIDSKLTFGDRDEDLRIGVGQYNGSAFPGETGTTLLGGHNTTDLGPMDYLDVNDEVVIETHYGTYTYRVTSKNVTRFDDPKAIETLFEDEGHRLILYTCYPVDTIGLTDYRLFVYADLISGPLIDENS